MGSAGNGLIFSMTVDGLTVLIGDAMAFTFWAVDTSGDSQADVVVALLRDATRSLALVFDAASGAYVCDAIGGVLPNLLAVQVNAPGCCGDVKRPAVAAVTLFEDELGTESFDFVPDDLGLARFNRPPTSAPTGGYAASHASAPASTDPERLPSARVVPNSRTAADGSRSSWAPASRHTSMTECALVLPPTGGSWSRRPLPWTFSDESGRLAA